MLIHRASTTKFTSIIHLTRAKYKAEKRAIQFTLIQFLTVHTLSILIFSTTKIKKYSSEKRFQNQEQSVLHRPRLNLI